MQLESLYTRTCGRPRLAAPGARFDSVVLVVLLNLPLLEVLPMVELLYRPILPTIVYCAPSPHTLPLHLALWNLTIVSYEAPYGAHNYICMDHVFNLHLEAEGYLFVGDDVLFSPSLLKNLSMPFGLSGGFCDMSQPASWCTGWMHFEGAKQSKIKIDQNLLHSFDSLPEERELIAAYTDCKIWLQNKSKMKQPLMYTLADIYYIPSKSLRQAALLSRVYFQQRTFLEVAVPEILLCLVQPSQLEQLDGLILWAGDRDEFWRYAPEIISGKKDFLHPQKLSYVMRNDTKFVSSFCEEILPFVHMNKENGSFLQPHV